MNWTEADIVERGKRDLTDIKQAKAERKKKGAAIEFLRDRGVLPLPPKRKPRAHPERDIQQACEQLLELDGWRIFRMEQNWSERKRKVVGEKGVPDTLAIRYWAGYRRGAVADIGEKDMLVKSQVLWCEWKAPVGRLTTIQRLWHAAERARGALTLVAGIDFSASVSGFEAWYAASGLRRRI